MKTSYFRVSATFAAAALATLFWGHAPVGANAANAYIFNAAAGDIPAKFARTGQEDKLIATHCIDGGGTKSVCLCVVKVLKHDLNMRDYQAIGTRIRPDPDAPRPLSKDRYNKTAPLTPLDPILRALLSSPDLNNRCETADLFYTSQKK